MLININIITRQNMINLIKIISLLYLQSVLLIYAHHKDISANGKNLWQSYRKCFLFSI